MTNLLAAGKRRRGAGVEPEERVALEWVAFGPDRVTVSDGGQVTEVYEDRHFAFTWHPPEHPTTVSLTFEKRGDGCVIDLKETGYRFEPQYVAVPLDVAAGWGEALSVTIESTVKDSLGICRAAASVLGKASIIMVTAASYRHSGATRRTRKGPWPRRCSPTRR